MPWACPEHALSYDAPERSLRSFITHENLIQNVGGHLNATVYTGNSPYLARLHVERPRSVHGNSPAIALGGLQESFVGDY